MPRGVYQDKNQIQYQEMRDISKEKIINKIKESGLVPVFNHESEVVCKAIIKACYEGGVRVFEFTNRSQSTKEIFTELTEYVHAEMPDMIIGTGSVIDGETTKHFIHSGADFIVSPALVPEMAEVCRKEGVMWIPGCGTVSEIVKAIELGAEIIKLFPGNYVGGPGFVKVVLGPLPSLSLMPTGGVSPDYENLSAWFDAGVCCVGMGSKLFPEDWINSGNFQKITLIVKNTLSIIKQIRTI